MSIMKNQTEIKRITVAAAIILTASWGAFCQGQITENEGRYHPNVKQTEVTNRSEVNKLTVSKKEKMVSASILENSIKRDELVNLRCTYDLHLQRQNQRFLNIK